MGRLDSFAAPFNPRRFDLRRRVVSLQIFLLVLAFGFLVLTAPEPLTAQEPAAAQELLVEGRVLDAAGTPLTGATLELVPVASEFERAALLAADRVHAEPVSRVRTGRDGSFRLAAPGPGMWIVVAKASGHVSRHFELFPLTRSRVLPETRLNDVTWLTVSGLPPAARVWAESLWNRGFGARLGGWRPAPRLVKMKGGQVRIPVSRGESLVLEAWAPGFAPEGAEVTAAAGSLSLSLRQLGERDVHVVDEQGEAVPQVQLRLGDVGWPVAQTDVEGHARVPAAPGSNSLWLRALAADGRQGHFEVPAVSRQLPQKPRFVLPAVQRVAGVVVAENNRRAVPGAWVWYDGHEARAQRTGSRGDFTLIAPTAPGGETTVVAEVNAAAEGYLPALAQSTAQEADGVTLVLRPAVRVRGSVVDEQDRPIAGVRVTAEPQPQLRSRTVDLQGDGARSDARGQFELTALRPETSYDLSVQAEGFASTSHALATVSLGEAQPQPRIILPRGRRVFGWIRDAETGEGIAGAVASLPEAQPSRRGRLRQRMRFMRGEAEAAREAFTDAEGRFEFTHVRTGAYNLHADAPGFVASTVPGLSIPEGEGDLDLGDIYLDVGTVLRGRVVDAAGQPLPEVSVSATLEGGGRGRRGPAREAGEIQTAADGVFEVPDLAFGGKVSLGFWRQGYQHLNLPGVEVPPAEPLEVVLQPASRVTGRVETEQGEPIEGARILLTSRGTSQGRMRPLFTGSEADGSFEIADVRPGSYQFSAVAPGYLALEGEQFDVQAGRDVEGLVAILKVGATVSGRVLDPQGRPLAGASVSLRTNERNGFRGALMNTANAITDGDGSYVLKGIAAGRRSFEAAHEEYQGVVSDLDVQIGANALDFNLGRGLQMRGRVVDGAGALLSGVEVTVLPLAGGRDFRQVVSDASGVFVVEGLSEGRYNLRGTLEGYSASPEWTEVQVVAGASEEVELVLRTGASVVGTISGLEFYQLSQVRITARHGRSGRAQGLVDHQGQYRIDSLAPGTWTVTATLSQEGRTAEGEVELPEGAPEARLDLNFTPGVQVGGSVVQGDEPVSNANVSLAPSGEGAEQRTGASVQTDYQGRFQLEVSEAGSYTAEVRAWDRGVRHTEEVEVAQGSELNFELPVNSVAGQVRDSTSKQPLSGVRVSVTSPQDRRVGSVLTGEAGQFRFDSIAAGDWILKASVEGYAPGEKLVTVTSGESLENILLDLSPTEGLTLDVTLPSGQAADRVTVTFVDNGNRASFSGTYRTSEGGRVHVPSAPPGQWDLLISGNGGATMRLAILVPGPPVPIRLPLSGALEITVPELESGAGGGPFQAELLAPNGRAYAAAAPAGNPHSAWTLRGGQARIDAVPVGAWTVRVVGADGASWSGTVTVTPGGVARLVL